MQLVVDIGNTRIKSYVFENDKIIENKSTLLASGILSIRQLLTTFNNRIVLKNIAFYPCISNVNN